MDKKITVIINHYDHFEIQITVVAQGGIKFFFQNVKNFQNVIRK
jgi:hypothetical protein